MRREARISRYVGNDRLGRALSRRGGRIQRLPDRLVFLPMTIVMTAVSLLAGRWAGTAAPRWSIFGGCMVFGAGLMLTAFMISPRPDYLQLAAALMITGAGIGSTVVPITWSARAGYPWPGGC